MPYVEGVYREPRDQAQSVPPRGGVCGPLFFLATLMVVAGGVAIAAAGVFL